MLRKLIGFCMYQSIHVNVGYSHFKINSNGQLRGVRRTKDQGLIYALLKLGNRSTALFVGFIEAENVVGDSSRYPISMYR